MENRRSEYDFRVIGRNLSNLRKAKNLSVEEVREYMQLGSVQAVYKWERGESLPQCDSLFALMELYEVDNIYDIVNEKESESSPSHFYLPKPLLLLRFCNNLPAFPLIPQSSGSAFRQNACPFLPL